MQIKKAGFLLVCLSCYALGCSPDGPRNPLPDEEFEGRDLSNSEYTTKHVSGPGFPGARCIDTMYKHSGFTTGRTDRWTKIGIAESDYEALWADEANFVRSGDYSIARSGDGEQLDRLVTNEKVVPNEWPSSRSEPPLWWQPPESAVKLEVSVWTSTTREDEGDTAYEDFGEYWLYDAEKETLWAWWWREAY